MSAPSSLRSSPNPWQRLVSIFLLSCSLQETSPRLCITKRIREFTHIVSDILNVSELFVPFCHAVGWLFILKPPQNGLIFALGSQKERLLISCNVASQGVKICLETLNTFNESRRHVYIPQMTSGDT